MATRAQLVDSQFRPILARYTESLAALRAFFERLSPVVTEADSELAAEAPRGFAESLARVKETASKAEIELIASDLRQFGEMMQQLDDPKSPKAQFTLELKSKLTAELLVDSFGESPVRVHHTEVMNRGILVSLVTHFEILISAIAHAHYQLHPAALDDQVAMKLSDLRGFSKISDAVEHLVDNKIDSLIRKSAVEWIRFLENDLKTTLHAAFPNKPQWEEVIQRRHVVVHADGQASRQYLSNVQWNAVQWPEAKPAVGTPLLIDNDYLRYAIDIFDRDRHIDLRERLERFPPERGTISDRDAPRGCSE